MPTRNSSSRSPWSSARARGGGRKAGLDLEVRAAAGRQRALGGDAAAGDEERARMTGLGAGRDDAALDRAQPGEPLELAADALERLQPVAQPRGVLVAARVGELARGAGAAGAARRDGPLELVAPQCACGESARGGASGSARRSSAATTRTTPSPRLRSQT